MIPDFAQSLFERFEREGIPLLLAGGWAVLMDIRLLLRYGHSRIPEGELKSMCERYAGPEAYDLIRTQT